MKSILMTFVILATQHTSHTYCYGEYFLGKQCIEGKAKTASGELLSKAVPSIALPLPKEIKLETMWIGLKTENGQCVSVKVNDRTAPRLVHKGGFDLSPAALRAIAGKADANWSGKLFLCDPKKI